MSSEGPTRNWNSIRNQSFEILTALKLKVQIWNHNSMLTSNFDFKYLTHLLRLQIVGNKAKVRISKRVLQQNKARQIFRKTNLFLPADTHMHVCVSGSIKCSFSENLACFVFL